MTFRAADRVETLPRCRVAPRQGALLLGMTLRAVRPSYQFRLAFRARRVYVLLLQCPV